MAGQEANEVVGVDLRTVSTVASLRGSSFVRGPKPRCHLGQLAPLRSLLEQSHQR